MQLLPGSKLELREEWGVVRVAPLDASTAGEIPLYVQFRDPSVPTFPFKLIGNNLIHVDPKYVQSLSLKADAPQGVAVAPGIPYRSYDSVLGYNLTTGLIQPLTTLTPWRLLETIRPSRGSQEKLVVDESVASAGSGSATYSPSLGTDYALFTGGISQDSLGTSPHDSYITVTDGNGNLMFKIRGALNSPFKIRIGPLAGTVNIAWKNGDSVAHWFLLNIYESIA